ncbi:MAG: protein kinase [Myxococcota bacterium]|nr:protein kinase [Myxococcota bacterium]
MAPIPPLSNGRYTLSNTLGQGGMATVYGAFDTMLEVERAVKVLSPALCSSDKLRRRFLAEARAMAKLRHPNIVTVFDVGLDGETPYIVMEKVDGGSVMDLVEQDGAQPPDVAGHILLASLAGLQASHDQGVIHRDMKPHNLLIGTDGTVKITDFGIAQLNDTQSFTKTGAVMGTLAYMPPEQRDNAKGVGPTADVFASGASLYAILTGREPFDIYNESLHDKLFAGVPAALRAVIVRSCHYEPAARYASAEAMAEALRGAMTSMGIDIHPGLIVPLNGEALPHAFSTGARAAPPAQPVHTTINPKETWFTTHGERAQQQAFASVPESDGRGFRRWAAGLALGAAVVAIGLVAGGSGDPISVDVEPIQQSAPQPTGDAPSLPADPAGDARTEPLAEAIPPPEAAALEPPSEAVAVVENAPASTPVARPRASPPATPAPKKEPMPPAPPAAVPPVVEQTAAQPPPPVPDPPAAGSMKVRVIPYDAALSVDGKAVRLSDGSATLSVEPGLHVLRFSTEGGRYGEQTVRVASGEEKRVCWRFFDDGRQGDCRQR